MDMMTQALKIGNMMSANPKEWEQARLEAFDKHYESNPALAEYAYEVLTEKVEKKEERRAIARERAEATRQKREAEKQHNEGVAQEQHNEGVAY